MPEPEPHPIPGVRFKPRMLPEEPVRFAASWPVCEQQRHFELGSLLNCAVTDAVEPLTIGDIGFGHAGCWECELADDTLFWSGGVYDLFGLPRGAPISRREAVRFYAEPSFVILERLRSTAIRQGRGFTLDAEIRPANGGRRWMRLIAAPVFEAGRAVRLHGLKLAL